MSPRWNSVRADVIVALVVTLLLAGSTGACTLASSAGLFSHKGDEEGWAVLFVYIGSLAFGGTLGLSALVWRSLAKDVWGRQLSPTRLWVKRLFGLGFAIVTFVMIFLLVRWITDSHQLSASDVVPILLFTGLPATAFGYATFRAWKCTSDGMKQ